MSAKVLSVCHNMQASCSGNNKNHMIHLHKHKFKRARLMCMLSMKDINTFESGLSPCETWRPCALDCRVLNKTQQDMHSLASHHLRGSCIIRTQHLLFPIAEFLKGPCLYCRNRTSVHSGSTQHCNFFRTENTLEEPIKGAAKPGLNYIVAGQEPAD